MKAYYFNDDFLNSVGICRLEYATEATRTQLLIDDKSILNHLRNTVKLPLVLKFVIRLDFSHLLYQILHYKTTI